MWSRVSVSRLLLRPCLMRFSYKATAAEIKALREMTGSGIQDCRTALQTHDGDMNAATAFLKEKGLAQAKKRQDKETLQGVVGCQVIANRAVMVEVNCETDFVAKCDLFLLFVQQLIDVLAASQVEGSFQQDAVDEVLHSLNLEDDSMFQRKELVISKIQENIRVRRIQVHTTPSNLQSGYYVHNAFDQQQRIGQTACLTSVSHKVEGSDLSEVINNLSLMIVGNSPQHLYRSEVDPQVQKEQHQLVMDSLDDKMKNKPEKVLQKVIEGKLMKFYQEVCLMDMHYFLELEDTMSVGQYIEKEQKKLGEEIKVQDYVQWRVGDILQ